MGVSGAPPGAAPAGPGVSKETFKQWTRTCGVRRIQKVYERMAEEGRENGRTATEEMTARGYKDFASFSKACPEFPLFCWPSEFAELGSGHVLYFHFLAMLGSLFLVLFLLQTPAMSEYASEDWREGWQWNEWKWAYTVRGCGCQGANNGIQRPWDAGNQPVGSSNSNYGISCGAWDMDLCSNETSCVFQSPAKWVCQQWCFVPSHCGTSPDDDDPSKSNRHYRGLVKSYSACTQTDELKDLCTGFRGANKMFNEPGVDIPDPNVTYIMTAWLTPGNLGPDSSDSALIPTMYTVCLATMCLIIFVQFQLFVMTNRQVDSDTISPNDFAILARGLPATATDGKAIAKWFRENSVQGREVEIVKVVVGWDGQEFVDKIRELKDLKAEKEQLEDGDERKQEIQKQIAQINSDLASSATEKAAKLRSSGVVVVIFRHQTDMRATLARWGSFWAEWFYSDATDTCLLPAGNKFWKGAELPRFPIGDPPQPIHKIQLERAPNPGDINWMELGVPWEKRMKMFMKTNGIMTLLVLVSFGLCYGLNKAQEFLKNGGLGGSADALAILPALGVGVMNAVLAYSARKLGLKEYHDTKTVEEFSQALKMSIGMIVNTAFVMFVINSQPNEWYQHGGLVTDAFTMLGINAVFPPFLPYFDIGYYAKKWVRRQLTQKKLDYMNEVGSRKPTTDEEKEELKKVRGDIEKFKRAYAPSPMNETRRYALALKTTVCCLFYMPVMPWIALVGALGLFGQYWIDKYLLLRWYKRPAKPASAAMAMFSLRFVKYVGPLGISISVWLFLTPSWGAKNYIYNNFIICLIISVLFSFATPLSIWTKTFFAMFGGTISKDRDMDYYKAQYMWSTEMKYHKDHFMLKPLPESVNPEYLSPGEEASTVSVEAVKASYGAATARAAEDAGEDEKTTLKGGKVMGGHERLRPAEPAPTTYGAPVPPAEEEPEETIPSREEAPVPETRPLVPAEAVMTGSPMKLPGSVKSSAPPAASVGSSKKGGEDATWEFEGGHGGWHRFDNDCHDFIEKQYQKWKAGKGNQQVEVRTGDKKLSVDFKRMTEKLVGSPGIHAIRRRT